MNTNNKQLSKKDQKKIVNKTHTGGLPKNVGFPGFAQFPNSTTYSSKSKVEQKRLNRNKQNG